MPLGYELVADIVVSSSTTQVDFTGLNFTSDDELLLVSDIVGPTTTVSYYIYANNDTTGANYYHQYISAAIGVVNSSRNTTPKMVASLSGEKAMSNVKIKLTDGGYFTYQASSTRDYSTSGVLIHEYYGSKISTISSITQLNIVSSSANNIGTGSRFKLYKLVAEPLADITTTSDTTQVDITGLNLDETNELLLVSDIQNGTASNANIELFFNNDTASTNYYKQELSADSTTISAGRTNDAILTRLDATNGDTVCYTNVKLTNSGYPMAQGNSIREVGTSGVNLLKDYLTKTGTVTSITQLNLKASVTNAIGTGSRFKLYKLK